MRREFALRGDDQRHLDYLGFQWESIVDHDIMRLIIHDFPIPTGYTVDKADLCLTIPPNYPDVQLDMAYFQPALCLISNQPIAALTPADFCGQRWQQWSRHRTKPGDRWRAGEDCIATHLVQVTSWLERACDGGVCT